MSVQGSCRCGQVTFEISAPPILTMACHCRGCQKMTSSAFSLSVAIPAQGFEVTAGEPVIGGLHGPTRHYFCPHCMSWLYTRMEDIDFFVNVRTTMLDQPVWNVPFIETYTSTKLPWVSVPATHSYPEFPPFETYQDLVAEYQAQNPELPG